MQNSGEVIVLDVLDLCYEVSDGCKIDLDCEKYSKYVDKIGNILETVLVEQIYGIEAVLKNQPVKINPDTKVSVETLQKINQKLDETMKEDTIYENFKSLLQTIESKKKLDVIIDIFEKKGIVGIKSSNLCKEILINYRQLSILNTLIQKLINGKSLNESMIEILNDLGIDLKKNPKVKRPYEIDNFLYEFKNELLYLVAKMNGGIFITHSKTLN